MMPPAGFELVSPFVPMGDQPSAIEGLVRDFRAGSRHACLLGATGTGKTFTMANVIAQLGKPTLIVSHNKTLAAQLFEELREFFPRNSVNYFVSYYDYYQPEAYIPSRDIYIEKDAARNDDLELLRLAATSNLLSRRDTIVVASVSAIFGLGSPEAYSEKVLTLTRGSRVDRRGLFTALQDMQYKRSDIDWKRACFRARGDAVEVWPAYERFAVRIELFGDEIERIELVHPTSAEVLAEEKQFFLYPAVHYVMPEDQLQAAVAGIRAELDARVLELRAQGKLLEAQRLLARTKYDLEMIEEVGFCSGIENYSRFMDGRMPGERPFTLLDYFDYAPPDAAGIAGRPSEGAGAAGDPLQARAPRPNLNDWLVIIDESHVTMPQVRAMFNGDRARKQVLVDHGFRLPSALDNRPLRFEEFESIVPRVMYVSATPAAYELERTGGVVHEQVIRPTGLVDPQVEVRPAEGQVQDLLERCAERVAVGERVIVTALTKRLCEDLASYLDQQGLRVRYLHSEIDTLDRVLILTDFRRGEFDVLVGVNLLREGLDLPEVSLVCILDADKEGYLRSATSLIQQMGRAARNVNARVVMYADAMTGAMREAIEETERRRVKQLAYNAEHGITPATIRKEIREGLEAELKGRRRARQVVGESEPKVSARDLLAELEGEMLAAAEQMEFELAADLRDQAGRVRELIAQHESVSAAAPGRATVGMPVDFGSTSEPLLLRRAEVEAALRGGPGGRKKKAGMPGVRATKKARKKKS